MEISNLNKQDVITSDELRNLKAVIDEQERKARIQAIVKDIKQIVINCAAQGRSMYVHPQSQLHRLGYPGSVKKEVYGQTVVPDYKQSIEEVIVYLKTIFVDCNVEYIEITNLQGRITDSGIKISWG